MFYTDKYCGSITSTGCHVQQSTINTLKEYIMKNIIVSIVLGVALIGAAEACQRGAVNTHHDQKAPHMHHGHRGHHGHHAMHRGHHRGFGAIKGSQRSNHEAPAVKQTPNVHRPQGWAGKPVHKPQFTFGSKNK